jgi:hypothetical protein
MNAKSAAGTDWLALHELCSRHRKQRIGLMQGIKGMLRRCQVRQQGKGRKLEHLTCIEVSCTYGHSRKLLLQHSCKRLCK